MINYTDDGDRMAIYIALKRSGEVVGSLGWANAGRKPLVVGNTQRDRAEIESLVDEVGRRKGMRASRPMVRAAARAWEAAAPENSKSLLLDTHTPSLSPVSLADLPFEILRHTYWRPQALGLRKDNVGAEAETHRKSRLPYYLYEKWPKEETWVNKVLDQLLAGAPPGAVGEAFAAVDSRLDGWVPGLYSEQARALRSHVGDPDFVLYDEARSALVLGEIKIAAKKTNGRYSFEQFSKYMLYGALVKLSGLARTVTHVIVAPSLEPAEFCLDHDRWGPQVEELFGRLSVERDAIRLGGGQKRGYSSFRTWHQYARACLLNDEWIDANGGYGPEDVDRMLDLPSSPVNVPTFVVSWDRLCRELTQASGRHHAGHLAPAIERLRTLGNGTSS